MNTLRESFDPPHGEIAEVVGQSPASVRRIARRARDHITARRPRVQVTACEQQAVVDRFLAALDTGRLQELMEVMAPDVVMIGDGGGAAAAALVSPRTGRKRWRRCSPERAGPLS